MFGRQMKLMRLFGFDVKVDASWFFLLFLVVWSLSVGYFPAQISGLNSRSYWVMGLLGAFGLFLSLILHEFSHSLVARRMGLSMKGITLFIFGGVAEMEEEPENAKTEFWMAIAGPITSVVLSGLFLAIQNFGNDQRWPLPALAVLGYLSRINLILAIFNMLPGFPLDGGRVLRSVLWAWKKDLAWATHWSVLSGSTIGFLMMALGILAFVTGNIIAGIWWVVIAMFLKGSATASEFQIQGKKYLKGEPISRCFNLNQVAIPADISIEDAVKLYFYKYHRQDFPVVENGQLLGVVTANDLMKIPKQEWTYNNIRKIYTESSKEDTITPDMDALEVLRKMRKEKRDFLLVRDQNYIGMVTLKDLTEYIAIKVKLEENQKFSAK